MGKRIIALFFTIIFFSPVIALPVLAQLTWEQLNNSGFEKPNTRVSGMRVFEESLYVGTINQIDGAQVWRYDGGTTWTQVNEDGFGAGNMAIQGITVFDDDLYVGTTNQGQGCQVWRYDGGTTWTQVNVSGFGAGAMVARVFAVFDGKLYVGVRNDTGGDNPEDMVGAQVWRYDGGTTWTQVNEDGFGNVPSGNNRSVESMGVVGGILYAGTWNDDDGCQVWRYDGGTTWTQVNENGFGHVPLGDEFSVALAMEVLGEELYVGTRNDAEGTKVWRYDGGTNWTQVNVTGFGSASNQAIWSLSEYNSGLYAGTMNMTQGGQVWRYDGGTTWTQVNVSGFGNTKNGMVTSMAVLDGQLCAGTDNKTDNCQVWGTTNPVTSIKANDSDGPLIISQGGLLTVKVSLDPGSYEGYPADWWVAAMSPFGLYWFTLDKGWVSSDSPIRVYGGPLFSLSPYTILEVSTLPLGSYTFYFAVDNNMDGILDATYLDLVSVTIQ